MKQLRLQAVTPKAGLVRIKADTDVFVYANSGAGGCCISGCALRADDAINHEAFWLSEAENPESVSLFLVRAKDAVRYDAIHLSTAKPPARRLS